MMSNANIDSYQLHPIGIVCSELTLRKACPHQETDEGAPEAWLEIDPSFSEALEGIILGCDLIVLTWLHQAQRDIMKVHPQRNPENPLRGVFATRSPDRPNPIGLHRVKVTEIKNRTRIKVDSLELVDGTPIIDIKSVLPKTASGSNK